jgi:sensor domain CHASE-containing protein
VSACSSGLILIFLVVVVVVVVLPGNRSQTVVTGKIKRLMPSQTPAASCKRSIY